jgi:hypothetical protein
MPSRKSRLFPEVYVPPVYRPTPPPAWRVYISGNISHPWHILVSRTDSALRAACGQDVPTHGGMYPGWPKEYSYTDLCRLFPSSVVCRACSDNAPLQQENP